MEYSEPENKILNQYREIFILYLSQISTLKLLLFYENTTKLKYVEDARKELIKYLDDYINDKYDNNDIYKLFYLTKLFLNKYKSDEIFEYFHYDNIYSRIANLDLEYLIKFMDDINVDFQPIKFEFIKEGDIIAIDKTAVFFNKNFKLGEVKKIGKKYISLNIYKGKITRFTRCDLESIIKLNNFINENNLNVFRFKYFNSITRLF